MRPGGWLLVAVAWFSSGAVPAYAKTFYSVQPNPSSAQVWIVSVWDWRECERRNLRPWHAACSTTTSRSFFGPTRLTGSGKFRYRIVGGNKVSEGYYSVTKLNLSGDGTAEPIRIRAGN